MSDTEKPAVFCSTKMLNGHMLILGVSGSGKSEALKRILTEARAANPDVTFNVVERSPEEIAEQAAQHAAMEQEREAKAEKRLNALKETYWNSSDEGDFGRLHDCMADYLDRAFSISEVKRLYMMLPGPIFGDAVRWGFSDTCVADAVCEFIQDNLDEVRSVVMTDGD